MLYAGYYNLASADAAAKDEKSRKSSSAASINPTSEPQQPEQTPRRSSLKKVLDALRPTEEPITPAGMYRPIIENGPLFSRRKSAEYKKMSRWEKNASVAGMMH